ncbi:MAG: YidC/Oxa1 family membrane protein insertase [Candidatus Gottesmanbacteria bacterium]|nr:YidC/Oxa1 family membrane protein insertase [Candidatus Gottesmanbacteria bacterium]
MTNPNLWNQLLVWPILNVLIALYKLFEFLHIPGPLGFAVIGLTLIIRLILYPLMAAQLRSAKKMAKIKPHMDALSIKHKDDKKALQAAQMALYKEHGVNPAAGCLPLLIQMPVLIALYNVFYQVLNNGNLSKMMGEINQVVYLPALKITNLDLNFFGINLALKPSQFQTHGYLLLLVPLITAALQWWQTKLMMVPSASASAQATADKKALAVMGEKPKQDMAADMQKQMAIITPIMFGYFAYTFPLGLALYWNIFGLFGILQQIAINKEK